MNNPNKTVVEIDTSRDRMIELLRKWHEEWEMMKHERDNLPMNHIHRQTYEGMCNTQMARISDLQLLIKCEPK